LTGRFLFRAAEPALCRIPGATCVNTAPFSFICFSKSYSCVPSDAHLETACTSCGRPSGGNPINLTNGNTYIVETDFALPGLGGGLSLTRTWNSKWPSTQAAINVGLFGKNWRSSYEERIFQGQDGYFKYSRADGSFWSFGYYGLSGGVSVFKVSAPAEESALLAISTDNSTWTLTFKDGTKKTFDYSSGWLKSVVDRNGNTTLLTYDSNNRLMQVTDPASRTLTFGYSDGSGLLITNAVSNAGTFTYTYSGNLLTKVTKPDNTFITFEYDGQSMIAAVKDTNGKILEAHTYDSLFRGLTSIRALGVDAVTVAYPKSTTGIIVTNP
jgi:YD repeat-containing protein